MIDFNTIILQFGEQGEKTGWTHIIIPADLAQQMKPGNKKSFRVRGKLDELSVAGMALMPIGDGDFMLALKKEICKGLRKHRGAMLRVRLEHDIDFKVEIPTDLQECFDFEPEAGEFFNTLTEGHRRYFINWINSAKTEPTRASRIANTINAMLRHEGYPEMVRAMQKARE
jgi:hypothetical protein